MPAVSREKENTALEAATDFLREVLKDGPALVQDIKDGRERERHRLENHPARQGADPCPRTAAQDRGDQRRAWPWEWYLHEGEEEARWEY